MNSINNKFRNVSLKNRLDSGDIAFLKKDKNVELLERKWAEIHMDYRNLYQDLSPEDLSYMPGEFDSIPERIAKRTFRNTQTVKEEILNWGPSLHSKYSY